MDDTNPKWIKPFARGGYAARGMVYLIIGVLAVFAAFDSGGTTNTKGALETLFNQPFGNFLIWLMVVGLIGYVCWRLIQSVLDTDDHGWEPKGLAVRAGLLASAFTYSTLVLYCLSLLGVFSTAMDQDSGGRRGPVGDFIAGIIGTNYVALGLSLIFAGVAIAHFYKAFTQKYEEHFQADQNAMKFIHPVSMVGLTARGLVFVVISILLLYRFLSAGDQGQDTPGIKDAMNFVQSLPAGGWLLAALGIGILLFAGYSFIEAKWRRINIEDAG